MPRNDVALFMAPKMSGYSCLDVEHLTAVEIEGRRRVRQMLDFYRREMPGFERAWLIDTSPQIGTRHSRRLMGVTRMTREAWTAGLRHDDEVGISPPPNARYPNVSIPLGCLVPAALDGLLAAGPESVQRHGHAFLHARDPAVLGDGPGGRRRGRGGRRRGRARAGRGRRRGAAPAREAGRVAPGARRLIVRRAGGGWRAPTA